MSEKIFVKDVIGEYHTNLVTEEAERLFRLVINSHFEKRNEWEASSIPMSAINRNFSIIALTLICSLADKAMEGMASRQIKKIFVNELTCKLNELLLKEIQK